MALGKKKEEKLEQAIEAAAANLPAPARAPEPEEEEDDTPLALLAAEPEPAADAAAPESAAGDDGALLSMFQGSELEVADLSVIVDLAGNVEIDDLLEELQTVAAALGIKAGATPLEAAA